MNIVIAGDICCHDRLNSISINEVFDNALSQLLPIVKESDYSIINLESPAADSSTKPIVKQGPSLYCSEEAVESIKRNGFSCVTLANNHFLDYGEAGVIKTITTCKRVGLDYVGGGGTLEEASQILIKTINRKKLAIINCCEQEFSIASSNASGSNPLDPIGQFYKISEANKLADFVLVIVHGGVEHFQYPTTRMLQTYRFFIDAGADAVINHHQHCPCGYEIYKNKPIFYGLGNFCFDWDGKRNSIWNLGYMVKLNLGDNHSITSEIIPYRQCDETPSVELLEDKELDDFNKMMRELCDVIQNPDILVAKLKEFNKKSDYLYRKMLEPYSGRIANGLYRRGWLPSTISKERVLALMDFLICESHHERVKELLERLYKQYVNE